MISEVRYVLRSLRRRKGFAVVTILTLALGIGAATAVYSMVQWALFYEPASSKGLYQLGEKQKDAPAIFFLWVPFYKAYSAQTEVFSELCAAAIDAGNVVLDNKPVTTFSEAVTPNFFGVLGVSPLLGRTFSPSEAASGRDDVVVVSYNFWKKHLGGTKDALGRLIKVDEKVCTVVGVLREGEKLPVYASADIIRPLVLRENPNQPWDPMLVVLGRLRPGVTREQAEDALARAKIEGNSDFMQWVATLRPALSTMADIRGTFNPQLHWALLGAVAFLYGIACLNASNLILVHFLGKRIETSVRMALGGGRWGILRLLFIETFCLCAGGALLGAVVANWLIPLLSFLAGNDDPERSWTSWVLGWDTYLVLAGLTLLTGAMVVVVPGLQLLRANILSGLKGGGGSIGESPGLARLRGTFVVLQATFAVILLVGAGLMVRSFQHLGEVKVGFNPAHRVKMQLGFPRDYPARSEERVVLLDRIKAALLRVPTVSSVAYGSDSLLANYNSVDLYAEAKDGSKTKINGVYVSPDYEDAGGLVLKQGRWPAPDTKGEIVINETYAHAQFGSSNAVGQYIRPAGAEAKAHGWVVAGVVGDVREKLREKPGSTIYMPAKWSPNVATIFVLHLTGEASGEMLGRLTQAVYAFDPRIVTYYTVPMAELRNRQLYNERLALSVLRVLACVATVLAIVGLFSVLAYTVDRRMPEFGIRMALGATPADLVTLVMRRGITLTVLGIAIGIGGAMALARFLQSLLFETPRSDPPVIAAVSALLLLSAVAACILPSVRASKPDLVSLLKSD